MKVTTNDLDFITKMNNIVDYSLGFLDGVKTGKTIFLKKMGEQTILALSQYIDAAARMNPEALHHVYEWYQVGSPNARLFNIDYTVSNLGLSFKSTFKQSTTASRDSGQVFYNKAKIMESGVPVVIRPKKNVLVFEKDGETIFTKNEVVNPNPGGEQAKGSYEKTFDEFFLNYFKQSFLRASGLYQYLNSPTLYKKNFVAGSKGGRSIGMKTGYTWIANTTIGVEG